MPATQDPDIQQIAKEIARIIRDGDIEALRRLYVPDARVWHNTDDTERSVEESIEFIQGMVGLTTRRWFSDVRLIRTETGFIHQHYTCAVFNNGQEVRVPTCVVITLEGRHIKRLEEYYDPTPVGAVLGTPAAG